VNPKGTPFQIKVWKSLLKIGYGETKSYRAQSKAFGDVKAIRAIAAASGKNPIWIVIPCHRVIGSDGSLTGYAGGVWRKKWLLDHENPVKQQSLF
jgi:methylated-DNA-[protein]-cysteine S-methyltransferase